MQPDDDPTLQLSDTIKVHALVHASKEHKIFSTNQQRLKLETKRASLPFNTSVNVILNNSSWYFITPQKQVS